MVAPSFTALPIEVREQIFNELLTFQSDPAAQASASSSCICKILTLNHQIYAEVRHFLRSRLLVVLKTNDTEFVEKIIKERSSDPSNRHLALISQLRSLDGKIVKDVSKAPIAMELDFYIFHYDRPAESYPAFLIPAASLDNMMRVLWSPAFYIWTMQASLSFNLINQFSHSKKEAQRQLLRPWLDAFLKPTFVGIFTNSAVDVELANQLQEKLKGDYDAVGHLKKLQSLQQGAVQKAGVGEWVAAAARFCMAMKYAEVIWDCHSDCIRDAPGTLDCTHHLWLMTNGLGASHVQVLLNSVTGYPTPDILTGHSSADDSEFANARAVAEKTVRFLRSRSEWVHSSTADNPQAVKALRKSKALTSFRAHAACKGMGDIDAAVGYLKEALKYEPETSIKLNEKIEALKREGARDEETVQGVARWQE